MTELHSLAPWFIARYQPRLEKTARANLTIAGFENWYPSFVDIGKCRSGKSHRENAIWRNGSSRRSAAHASPGTS